MKVLIVDDSPPMRRIIGRAVEQVVLQAVVTEASDGAEALALMALERFDLVLSDLYMPRLNGVELLERRRQDPALASVPIVMITTETAPAVLQDLLDRGANGCLSKPFTRESLARVLAAVLGPDRLRP